MDNSLLLLTGQKKSDLKKKKGWLDLNEPQVVFFQGKRKSGKGVAIDQCVYRYWLAHFTILDLWAARNNENTYYALNKDCKATWDEWRLIHKEELKNGEISEPLHCNCNKAIPIFFAVPDYVYKMIDKDEVARHNKEFFESYEEYKEAYDNGIVTDFLPNESWIEWNKIRKPKSLRPNPMIKLVPFTIPKGAGNQEKFWSEFTEIILTARKERRIIVMNPMMFIGNDKFVTVEYILRNIYKVTFEHFKPLTEKIVGKPRSEWGPREKGHDKLAIILGEVKTLSPSQKLSPEKGSGATKKAVYDFIGEARHWKVHFITNYQSPEDLFSGVKYQADIFVIKRATKKLLGDDWGHLFGIIEGKRDAIFNTYGKNPKTIEYVDKKFPMIQELPDNYGYIVIDDETLFLQKFNGSVWHHKHTKDHFVSDFGINLPKDLLHNIKKETDDKGVNLEALDKKPSEKKKIREQIMKNVDVMVIKENMKYPQIHKKLLEQFIGNETAQAMIKKVKTESLGENYRRWKKTQIIAA